MNLLTALMMLLALATGPQPQRGAGVDMQRSSITVYVSKQGLFSFLADNHVINAPIASASYDREGRSVELTVDASKMQVLDPNLPADKRATVQSNMVGPQVLDAAKYPTIVFQSTSMEEAKSGSWTVTGNLQLHGQTHSMTFELRENADGHFTGSTTVRQSAYGITPIKVAGGAVSVKDDVRIQFDIVAPQRPTP
jgi:polyisoprenoid-binding protein YceI